MFAGIFNFISLRALFALVILLSAGPFAVIDEAVPAKHPTIKDYSEKSCLLCHGGIKEGEQVHSLFQISSCDACHRSSVEDGTTYMTYGEEGAALCANCHSDLKNKLEGSKHVHGIIAEGGCVACHDPHAAANKNLLKGKESDLCGDCHSVQAGEHEYPHAAIVMMACVDCHEPHGSNEKALLGSPETELCAACHDPTEDPFRETHGNQPVTDLGCSSCHDPHGSEQEKLLKDDTVHPPFVDSCGACHGEASEGGVTLARESPGLCYMCHSDIEEAVEKSAYAHMAMEMGCSICHEPHMADRKALLKGSEAKLCGVCHDPQSQSFKDTHQTQPVEEGECSACHEPHGSNRKSLLKGKSLHEPFAEGNCYGCHISPARGKALLKKTGDILCMDCHDGMDDGENKHAALEAMGCKDCHRYHQSDHDSLLVSSVRETCGTCHPADEAFEDKHGGVKMKDYICGDCHDPHSSGRENLLGKGKLHDPFDEGMCSVCHEADEMKSACVMCHGSQGEKLALEYPHAAVAAGGCESCHEPHIGDRPALLNGDQAAVCSSCHDSGSESYEEKHFHQPPRKMNCSSCHDPHGSAVEHLFKGDVLHTPFEGGMCESCHIKPEGDDGIGLAVEGGELCYMCHPDVREQAGEKSLHTPFAEERCTDCHDPHLAAEKKLLPRKGNAFCLSCHESVAELVGGDNRHAAVDAMGCLGCHDAHASGNDYNLAAPYPDVCSACHDISGEELIDKHGGSSMDGLDCGSCHNPHGSNGEKLINEYVHDPFGSGMCDVCHPGSEGGEIAVTEGGSDELCFMCHGDKKAMIEQTPVKHPVMDMGDCNVCHNPHSSKREGLLKESSFLLCLDCHAGVGERMDEKKYIHRVVTEMGCHICHMPHGSEVDGLMRKPVNEVCKECHYRETDELEAGDDGGIMLFSRFEAEKNSIEDIIKLPELYRNENKGHPDFGHPVFKADDPYNPGREFNCVSCHYPHASDHGQFLKGNPERRFAFCANCHKNK